MIAWVWNSRLTWRASFVVTAALCMAVLGSTGIGGAATGAVTATTLTGWLFVISRLADNEARHAAVVAIAKGRPVPRQRLRRLLFPIWARATLFLAALGATLLAAWRLESNDLVALTYGASLGAAWLVERTVIAVRSRA